MKIHSIEVKNLSLYFGNSKVFENLCFKASPGFSHLTSRLGSGKSSILKLLAGSLAPSDGEILINDQDVSDFTFEEWSELRQKIGYSFDSGGLLNNRSLFDNLLLPLQYHNLLNYEDAVKRVDDLLTKFNLSSEKHLRPSEVSGSQKKATCVARSLILHPEVLLLDEPTVGLKAQVKEAFFKEVEKHIVNKNLKFVICASDDQELLERFRGPSIQEEAA